MTDEIMSGRERRKLLQQEAAAKGIDEAYISVLVDTFYSRIRVHPELGPIFNTVIGDNWDAHLSKLKDFWSSVALNTGVYSGQPVPVHKKLANVAPEHFQTWLGLFHTTLEETAPSPEAVEHFMERANRIAESLKLAMFGLPGLPPKPLAPSTAHEKVGA